MRTLRLAFALAAAATLLPLDARAQRGDGSRQSDSTFRWSGRVAEGDWLILRNLNGAVRVEAGTSDQVEISAVKRWRRGDPDEVRITVNRIGTGERDVLVCALWGENASCDEDGYRANNDGRNNRRSNDVSVEFTVRLPRGVKIETSTVNGSVRIAGATSEVDASTVNGGITAVSAAGPVRANTVNGNIDVQMGNLGSGDLEYSTVNGSVTLQMPSQLNAELDMSTVNGSLRSDYPLTLEGRISPRRIRATVGDGGRRIKVRTVNGSVELRKSA